MFWNKQKRKFSRLNEHHLLKYKVMGDGHGLSFVRNISRGGVLFFSKQEISSGEMLEMEISMPPKDIPVKVVAKVVHTEKLEKVQGYNIGVEFVTIDDKDREFMEEHYPEISPKKGKKDPSA